MSAIVSRATSSIVAKRVLDVGVLGGAQPPESGVDEDDVDRVAGGVVQVARDPDALLRGGEAPLALGLALGAQRALLSSASCC